MISWSELVEQHGPTVYRVALRIVGQAADAEDVVQEVFLEVHRLWRSRETDNWSAVLRTLATRRAIDSLRRRRDKPGFVEYDPLDSGSGPEDVACVRELQDQLRAGIGRLPQQQAEIFTLHCLEGLSHQEIAHEARNHSPRRGIGTSQGSCSAQHRSFETLGELGGIAMREQTQAEFDKVVGALRETPVSESSMLSSLARAKQIQSDAEQREEAATSLAVGRDRSVGKLTGRRTATVLLATAVLAVFTLWATGWNRQALYAQLPQVLSDIERAHLVIHSSDREGQIDIWFQRGAGFAMDGPVGVEIDDGATYWNYYRSRKLAIRSKSRLGNGRFTDIQQLGKVVGCHVDEMPRALERLEAEDQLVDETKCKAFAWHQESLGPIAENWNKVEELWPDRRLVLLLDESSRLRRWRQQRGLSGRWKTYRTIDVNYPEQIAMDRFVPQFGEEVKVVDSGGKDLSIDAQVSLLIEGVRRRHAAYRDVEFELDVTADLKASPESQFPGGSEWVTDGQRRTKETLAIMSPSPEQLDRPWRRWVQAHTDESDTNTLLRFAAFDGAQSRLYRIGKVGQVLPGELWNWFSEHRFQELLFLGINGVSSITPMSEDVRNVHLNRMHITDRSKQGEVEIVTILGCSSAEFGMEYCIEMTTEPDYLILRWEARFARRNNQLVGRYAVTDIGEFDGIKFPSRGTYRQMPLGELPDITYAFEVIGCERLDQDDREDWFPPWPAETLVK